MQARAAGAPAAHMGARSTGVGLLAWSCAAAERGLWEELQLPVHPTLAPPCPWCDVTHSKLNALPHPSLPSQEELQLPIDPDAPMVAFVGRLDPQKGADILLQVGFAGEEGKEKGGAGVG